MADEDKEQFKKEEPIVVPLTPPQSPPKAQPLTAVKGGVDKVTGTHVGMTTDTGRFKED